MMSFGSVFAILLVIEALALGLIFVFAFFWAPRRIYQYVPLTEQFAGQPPPQGLLWTFIKELFSLQLIILSLLLTPFFGRSFGGGRRGSERPVVFVHGYLLTNTCWLFLLVLLRLRRVRAPIYSICYNSLGPLTKAAIKLEGFVAWVAEKENVEEVDIVSHSWGGVVSRWYVERLGGRERVRRLIELAPINQGTFSGTYAFGLPAQEGAPGSWAVMELAPPFAPLDYTVIWSRSDAIVVPQQFAHLDPYYSAQWQHGGVAPEQPDVRIDQIELPSLGHLTELVSPRVADLVAERLKDRSSGEVG